MDRFIQSLTAVLSNDPGATHQQCQSTATRLHDIWKDRAKELKVSELIDAILNTQEGDPKVRITLKDQISPSSMGGRFLNVGTRDLPFIMPTILVGGRISMIDERITSECLEKLLHSMCFNTEAVRSCLDGRLIVSATVLILVQIVNLADLSGYHNATERYHRILCTLMEMLDTSGGVLTAAIETRVIPLSSECRPKVQIPSNKALLELIEHRLENEGVRITTMSFSDGVTLTF